MKKLKHITNAFVWTVVSVYALLSVLLHVPAIQQLMGSRAAAAMEKELGTQVRLGRIELGFFNRLLIDDVHILDQQGEPMIAATRLSVKPDLGELLQGRIVITSAQLFGMKAWLYQQNAQTPANFQFLIDSLSTNNDAASAPLHLRINSLIIRHGSISFHRRDVAPQYGRLTPHHIDVTNISTHIILNALTDDSLNLNLKRLSLNERSGLKLKNLKLKLTANRREARLENCHLQMPNTSVTVDSLHASYRFDDDRFVPATLQYEGNIGQSHITPSDISCFVEELKNFVNPIFVSSRFSGTSNSLRISELNVESKNHSIQLLADGSLNNWNANPRFNANIHNLHLSADGIRFVADNLGARFNLPEEITRLGSINYQGSVGGNRNDMATQGILKTDAGNVELHMGKHLKQFNGQLNTAAINLGQVLADNHFGTLATNIHFNGSLPEKGKSNLSIKLKGKVSKIEYNQYVYNNISIDGTYQNKAFDGSLKVDDPNAKIAMNGRLDTSVQTPAAQLTANIENLAPQALHLSNQWGNAMFRMDIAADFTGNNINSANGSLRVNNLRMTNNDEVVYAMNSLLVEAFNQQGRHRVKLASDFANLQLEGSYDYGTLVQSFANLVADKLPTLPGLPQYAKTRNNNFTLEGTISNANWLRHLLGIPIDMEQTATLSCQLNDFTRSIILKVTAPQFSYNGAPYKDARLSISAPGDTLSTHAHVTKIMDNGERFDWNITAHAANNHLNTLVAFDNHQPHPFKGTLNADAQFFRNPLGQPLAQIDVRPSSLSISDTTWHVKPSRITYSENDLVVDHFAVTSNDNQHLVVNGRGSRLANDSLTIDLRDINVRYILDLVNFHSVDFDGRATGKAVITSLFNKPDAQARLSVADFRFQNGRMGTLMAEAHLNNEAEQIDIHAIANDDDDRHTLVDGFVSPQRNEIDLALGARRTRAEFLESFCGSFMDNVDVDIVGDLRLHGPLSAINLTGLATTNGHLTIKPLNTTYRLNDVAVRLQPDEILFENDTVRDRNGNIGIVNGALHHKNLTRLTYDLNIEAQSLLAYDYPDFAGGTICGTVYGTGTCGIHGRSGEVVIDINVTPNSGTVFAYNAASPDALRSQEFVHWNETHTPDSAIHVNDSFNSLLTTNIRMNLLINATPDATLRVVMDNETGDHIALNGTGMLRATYYNKGAFDMFGNYAIDHGTYKMTIQNVIKKEFDFVRGGTIVFGGDPYNAQLNLQAQYAVNGVSLSDLQIGRSFTSNNIRVNCLMNISGTPYAPHIDFDLDMPTVDSNAKQMVFSLINSEEEMNQQVLYLLAVGRFYAPDTNNAATENPNQQSQTSLAMQSILSGALSQQLSNIIGSVANSSKWNVGANISTGAEGFYNAEYEGLLTGRLLHNRLLINGQFGYRDNVNNPNNSSFIGDFDIRYLLRPNGNLAVKVYNQTNDRYFTRNSLTTQGLGIIMKKDFNGWRDLFSLKKKKKKKKK